MTFTYLFIIITPIILFLYNIINLKFLFRLLVLCAITLFIYLFNITQISYNGIIFVDNWKIFLLTLVLLLFVVITNLTYRDHFDVYLLYFLVLIGSLVIILCDHLLIIYLGLELQTFSLFILISKDRTSIKGSEAGLKYFILGAISSGIYLLGLCLIFLSGVSLSLKSLLIHSNDSFVLLGTTLILISFCFKLGLSPFHFWLPDIYEGSSWSVLTILSTIPKISVLCVFVQLLINTNLIIFCCLGSVIIGTLGAFNQTKLKRLLAYSSISQMGFIILGITMVIPIGYEISFIYLLIYMITILSIFIMIIITPTLKECYIVELGGLHYINRILSLTWLIMFLSVAGIPPLSGFISKWFILWNIIFTDYFFSSIILIIFSIVGAVYYLRIIKIVYFQKQACYLTWNKILTKESITNNYNTIFLGFGLFFSFLFIINLNPLLVIINYLFLYFY